MALRRAKVDAFACGELWVCFRCPLRSNEERVGASCTLALSLSFLGRSLLVLRLHSEGTETSQWLFLELDDLGLHAGIFDHVARRDGLFACDVIDARLFSFASHAVVPTCLLANEVEVARLVAVSVGRTTRVGGAHARPTADVEVDSALRSDGELDADLGVFVLPVWDGLLPYFESLVDARGRTEVDGEDGGVEIIFISVVSLLLVLRKVGVSDEDNILDAVLV